MVDFDEREVTDLQDRLTDTQKKSFKGPYRCVLLQPAQDGRPADVLWRFTRNGKRGFFSDFWVLPPAMNSLMHAFRDMQNYSPEAKREAVRENLAILEHWNTLDWRVQVRVKKEVVAYVGITGAQEYFPPLTKAEVEVVNKNQSDLRRKQKAEKQAQIQEFYGGTAQAPSERRIGGFEQVVVPRFAGMNNAAGELYAEIGHRAQL